MNKATPWIVLVVIIAAATGWYFYQLEAPEEHPSVVSLPVPEPGDTPKPPASYPVEEISIADEPAPEPLPALEQSDEAVIEALAAVIGAESLGSVFVLEQVISRIVATIDSLDSRQLAPLVMPVLPPAGEFRVSTDGPLTIHPDNAQRYAAYTGMAAALDTQRAVDVYVRFYPLFQQAYSDLGYGHAHFNDRLVTVIDHLLATSEITGDPALVKPEAVYLFEDPGLEALSAGQKLLLRTGPSNAAVIRSKLREIRSAITQS